MRARTHTRRQLGLAVLVAVATGLFVVPASSSAAVSCAKYASPAGSDAATGTSIAPYKTAQKLSSSLTAGQTGCLRGGSYAPAAGQHYVLSPTRGGASGAPITIRSYPGERARLVGIVNVASGINYVTLSDLVFEGTGTSNTIKVYSADVTIENSEITNGWRGLSCMILGSSSAGQALRTTVRGNTIHGCGSPANGNKDHGIYAANTHGGQIVDNVFYDSAAYAIQLYPNAQGMTVSHNVIDGGPPSVRGGIVIGGDNSTASSSNVVIQNVIAYAQTYNITTLWTGPVGSNFAYSNCLWAGRQGEVSASRGLTSYNRKVANPLFVDRAAHDYRLAPDSPCLSTVGYDTAARSTVPSSQ
jgi:hypothetical protein